MNSGAGGESAAAAQPHTAGSGDYELLLDARRQNLVRIDQPIALITQAPRSGGTLLLRLFDGHPDCHTVPFEFGRLGLTRTTQFGSGENAWSHLHDDRLASYFTKGFGQSHRELHGDETRYPMLLPPSFHRALFHEVVAEQENLSDRDYVNAYLTALFNAWLDNQNLYGPPKKWVAAFAPRLIASAQKLERFRELYPDGHVISIIRDPVTWYSSASRWSRRQEWTRLEPALEIWTAAAEAVLAARATLGDALTVLSMVDLLERPRETMKLLANRLQIRVARDAMLPTYNKLPIRANSSFAAGKPRVSLDPLKREVDKRLEKQIRAQSWDLYRAVLAAAARVR